MNLFEIYSFWLSLFFIGFCIPLIYNIKIEKRFEKLSRKKIYFLSLIILFLFIINFILSWLFWGKKFKGDFLESLPKFSYYFLLYLISFPISLIQKKFWSSLSRFFLFLILIALLWEIGVLLLGLTIILPVPIIKNDMTVAVFIFIDFVPLIVAMMVKFIIELKKFFKTPKVNLK